MVGWSESKRPPLFPHLQCNALIGDSCDTFEKQKSYISNLKAQLPSDKTTYTRVYKYTFLLAKTAQQKAVPLEQARDCWDLLQHPLVGLVEGVPRSFLEEERQQGHVE